MHTAQQKFGSGSMILCITSLFCLFRGQFIYRYRIQSQNGSGVKKDMLS